MWKKIRSNRNPDDTLYSELTKELRPWLEKAGQATMAILCKYPRLFYGFMVMALLGSAALSFTLCRQPKSASAITIGNSLSPAGQGIDQLIKTSDALARTIRLKAIIDSLTSKSHLTGADSALLLSSLDKLRAIHPPLK